MEEEVKYLHIGCGNNVLPRPFYNLDARFIEGIDYLSEADKLDFPDNTFDMVYSSHVLEHFYKADTQRVLNEWVRVLKPGGIIRLSVPSLENLIKIYQKSGDISFIIGPLMGGQTYAQNFHYNAFDTKSLTQYLINSGCEAAHPWDYRRTSHSAFFDFSQATTMEMPISLNLEARKKLID